MPLIIDILCVGLYAVLFFVVITQVFIPLFRGTKLFPACRKKIRDADRVMTEMREDDYEEEITRRVQKEEERRRHTAAMNTIIDVTTFRK